MKTHIVKLAVRLGLLFVLSAAFTTTALGSAGPAPLPGPKIAKNSAAAFVA